MRKRLMMKVIQSLSPLDRAITGILGCSVMQFFPIFLTMLSP